MYVFCFLIIICIFSANPLPIFFRRSLFSLSGPLLFHCCSQGALLWDNQQPWSCLSPCALPPVCSMLPGECRWEEKSGVSYFPTALSAGWRRLCGEQPIVLAAAQIVWSSHGNPLPNHSIRCNPILVVQASFGDKRWPLQALSPLLFGNNFHICVYLGSFYFIGFL